ncbi:MAG: dicarboxylate/amino acid:cation symporter [Niabella sp.]
MTKRKKLPQWAKLLLGFILGLILGLIAYYAFPESTNPWMTPFVEVCKFAGMLFLRIIMAVVVPLIVSALILGVFELAKGKGLGKVAGRSMFFTILFSSLAVVIALLMINFIQPGKGVTFDKEALAKNAGVIKIEQNAQVAKNKTWQDYIVDLIPQNPIDSAAKAFNGEIVAVMIFSLLFGYALSLTIKNDEEHPIIKVLDAVFNASLKVIEWALKLAPFGIFGLVFNTTYSMGGGFLGNLAAYAGVVIGGLLVQQFVVYGIALKMFGKVKPLNFMKKCREVYLYAFSTASSNATLPVALEAADKKLNIPDNISRFVLTIGASANQNGTALFEGMTVLFIAQVYGIDLTVGQQLIVVLMSILAGIGTAGVPGGSLPLIVVLLMQVGVPPEGIGLVLGVDRLLDMCRTTLNVSGDLVIAQCVSAGVPEITNDDDDHVIMDVGAT